MVFIEFTTEDSNCQVFVGASLQAVLNDTNKGKSFGGIKFKSHRGISFEEVRAANFKSLDRGMENVQSKITGSFWLGTIHK